MTNKKKTYAKLGYSTFDTAEIVTQLNRLLSAYSVYQQKARNFHWNISGQDFFEFHGLFEGFYKRAAEETDAIAERVRFFGQKPASTFTEYIKLSELKEENRDLTSYEMARVLSDDIRNILDTMELAVEAAKEINDNGTEYMLKSFIYMMEKDHWMLMSWLKQKI